MELIEDKWWGRVYQVETEEEWKIISKFKSMLNEDDDVIMSYKGSENLIVIGGER